MPLFVTPRQLSLRAEFYHQLGAMLSAGLPLRSALATVIKSPPDASFRKPAAQLDADLDQGFTFSESMVRTGGWLPAFDIALLEAGEQTGRLDSCFKLLSRYYGERAQVVRTVLGQLSYPVFLFHFAVFVLPIPELFQGGGVKSYLMHTIGSLIPIYAVVLFLVFAAQGKRGEAWRARFEAVRGIVPLLGSAGRDLALARLAAALEALISAGVSIIHAWELAAAASGSPALKRAVNAWRPRLEAGETPAEAVNQCKKFPELFANLYHSGEISGRLEETLGRLHAHYQEEGVRKLRALAEWFPRMVYLFVALMIAWQVVRFWVTFYSGMTNVFD